MNKFIKISLRILPIIMMGLVFVSNAVFGIAIAEPTAGAPIGTITTASSSVYTTVTTIVQMLAVAAVVIAGVRYMFASAEAKGDIKNQTIGLVFGAILVFMAIPVLNFIQGAASSVIPVTP